MTLVYAKTACMGAVLLFVGILLAWYADRAGIPQGPALLVQSIGAFLLAVGLYLSL